MTRRRLILYLLLNVLISATVTGLVLFLYDRFIRPDCTRGVGARTDVTIVGVAAPGDLQAETVTLINSGTEPVVLTGWMLQDGEGATFTFPQLTLYPGGSVRVHTASGKNTIVDLYWGSRVPLWRSGKQVVLYDVQGLARAFYRIP
jgi:hypothetical protein